MPLPEPQSPGTSPGAELRGAPFDEERHWLQELLRLALRASGVGALVVATSAACSGSMPQWLMTLVALAGLLFIGLSRFAQRSFRSLRAVFLVMLPALLLLAVPSAYWSPGATTCLSLSVVFAGLLAGRGAALLTVALYGVSYTLGGFAVKWQLLAPVELHAFATNHFGNWLRYGIATSVLALVSAKAVSDALASIARGEIEERRALQGAEAEQALSEQAQTERRRKEEALRNALKLQTVAQLGQGFAHLFNNVITVIRAAIEESRQAKDEGERQAAFDAVASVARLGATRTRELLALGRPHERHVAAVSVREELVACQRKAVGRLRGNVRLVTDELAEGAVRMPCSWFEQIVMHLLVNAEQAMPLGGTVTLALSRVTIAEQEPPTLERLMPGEYLKFSVSDEGSGMTAETLQHAVEPFYTTKGHDTHEGLGLTVVSGMLRQLGGSLALASSAQGTTVSLYLPCDRGEETVPFGSRATEHSEPSSRRQPAASASPEPPPKPRAVPWTDWRRASSWFGRREPRESRAADVEDWRSVATRRLVSATIGLLVLGAGIAFVQMVEHRPQVMLSCVPPLLLLSIAAGLGQRRSQTKSVLLILALFVVGSLLLLLATFMSPSGVLLLTLSILLAAELFGFRASALLALSTFAVYLLGGWFHAFGAATWGTPPLEPGQASSWWRIGLFLTFGLSLFAASVLYVATSCLGQFRRVRDARRQFEQVRRQRREQSEATTMMVEMVARAARMETAGRLIGTVAHDLNNSLQSIITWIELWRAERDDQELWGEAVSGIEQAADYAEALIQPLQLGTVDGVTERSLDLGEAVTRMRGMLEALLRRAGQERVELCLRIERNCHVRIGEAVLRRMLLNLVANARDALAGAGTCTIRLSQQGERVRLMVEDDGPGMDETTLSRVAEPFFTTKGDKGTGLGLHSVKQLASLSGGQLAIRSQPGHGTTIALEWALAEPLELHSSPKAVIDRERGKGRILLVEDEDQVRLVLSRTLARAGYTLVTASDGDEAMERVRQGDVDLLCTDAIMPGRPTAEVIEQYVTLYRGRPVIVISGHLPEEFGRGILKHPAVSFLAKPFTGRTLIEEIERRLHEAQ